MALTVDASTPAAAVGSGATTSPSAFTPPGACLLVALCNADANNGNNSETGLVADSQSVTWTNIVLGNGNGGAVSFIAYRRITGASPGSITVSQSDSFGSVAKGIVPIVFTDPATGIAPDVGASVTGTTAAISIVSTVANSWFWSTALTANATLAAGTNTSLRHNFGGFDTGDAIGTFFQTSTTATPGTTVTNTLTGTATIGHHVGVEIIPGSAGTTSTPLVQQPYRRRIDLRLAQKDKIAAGGTPDQVAVLGYERRRTTVPMIKARRRVFPAPSPITVAPPLYIHTRSYRRKQWSVTARGRRTANVTPAQVVAAVNPAIAQLTTSRFRKALPWMIRRQRVDNPILQQDPPMVFVAKHGRPPVLRRAKITQVPLTQQQVVTPNPPITHLSQRIRRVGVWFRRNRATEVVAVQVAAPVIPVIVQLILSRIKRVAGMLRRQRVDAPVLTQDPVSTFVDRARKILISRRARLAGPPVPAPSVLTPKITFKTNPRRSNQKRTIRGHAFAPPPLPTIAPPIIIPDIYVRTEVDTVIVVSGPDTVTVRTEVDTVIVIA